MNLPPDIRVALVHDWLTGMRGGEKCLEAIADLFPRADIFTLVHLKGKVSEGIEAHPIHTSFIQRLPFPARFYRQYLPLFPAAVERFDLSGYDLVISTSHCVAKGAMASPGACHVSYCFTPMRYAWDQYQAYFGHLRGPRRWVTDLLLERLRRWDVASAARPDEFLTISAFVAERIRRYYGRRARVVHPPVNTAFFAPGPGPADYYLAVAALVPYKRLDLAVKAAPLLGYPLKIVGSGPEERSLRGLAGPGVEFLGWVGDEQLRSLYQGCRALLFPGEEDFGLAPVEAMACGRPVVAFGRGGVTETVTGLGAAGAAGAPTGVFFDRQDPQALAGAVRTLEGNMAAFEPSAGRLRALLFSPERFRKSLLEAIAETWRRKRP